MSEYSSRKEYNVYMREYMLQRYHHRRRLARCFLGGSCVKCGATKNLEFDHINPEEKTADIAKI